MNPGRRNEDWWSGQWIALLYDLGADPELISGRMSRRIRVLGVQVTPGQIRGRVRSREKGEGEVIITAPVFTDEQWARVIDGLSSQALFAARLLVGELPVEVEQVFAQANVSLLPENAGELSLSCTLCSPRKDPCLPLVAVMRRFSEMLQRDPWLLFLLRGREQEAILQALRASRTTELPSPMQAASGLGSSALPPEKRSVYYPRPMGDPMQPDPLTMHLEAFWGDSGELAEIHHHIAPPAIDLALLRRLGYPPLSQGGAELYHALAQAYRRVTQEALNLAYAADPRGQDEREEEGDDGLEDEAWPQM